MISPNYRYFTRTLVYKESLTPGGKYYHSGALIIIDRNNGQIPDNITIQNERGPVIIIGNIGRSWKISAEDKLNLDSIKNELFPESNDNSINSDPNFIWSELSKANSSLPYINSGICLVNCNSVGIDTSFTSPKEDLKLINCKLNQNSLKTNVKSITVEGGIMHYAQNTGKTFRFTSLPKPTFDTPQAPAQSSSNFVNEGEAESDFSINIGGRSICIGGKHDNTTTFSDNAIDNSKLTTLITGIKAPHQAPTQSSSDEKNDNVKNSANSISDQERRSNFIKQVEAYRNSTNNQDPNVQQQK